MDAARCRLCNLLAVRDQNDGGKGAFCNFLQDVQHLLGVGAVEVACRLVGQQKGRFVHQGAGNGCALHFPTAELVREMTVPMFQSNKVEHFHGGHLCVGALLALKEQGHTHIFQHVHVWQQVEKLEDDPELVSAVIGQLLLIRLVQRELVHVDLAAIGGVESSQEMEQGAFAAAARASDGNEFAGSNLERDVIQGHDL